MWNKKREACYYSIDDIMYATYSKKLNFTHKCKDCWEICDPSATTDKNIGSKDFLMTPDYIGNYSNEDIVFPGSGQDS